MDAGSIHWAVAVVSSPEIGLGWMIFLCHAKYVLRTALQFILCELRFKVMQKSSGAATKFDMDWV